MSKKDDFSLEEAALDDWAGDLELVEVPLKETAFRLMGFLAFVMIMIAGTKLLFLNLYKGSFYRARALENAAQISVLPASRGIIYDRYGRPLVANDATYKVEIKLAEILKDNSRREEITSALSKVLNINQDDLENIIDAADPESQDSITLPAALTEEDVKNLNQAPQARISQGEMPITPLLDPKIIQVIKDYKRHYADNNIFSSVLGYVGYATDADLNNGISLNDFVGKSGLESYYDKNLRGANGEKIFYRNAHGEILDDKFLLEPKSGLNLETSIDRDLQIVFYNSLQKKIEEMGSPHGIGIALNPQNGEILALINISNSNSGLNQSFFNRAISGLYSPGSTIKPLVAFAALKENFINPQTQIFSRGYIEVPNPYFPDQPARFSDWKPNGWVDMYSALARSSNIYFYALTGGLPKNEEGIIKAITSSDHNNLLQGIGIEKLKQYWQMFGLGDKTGIDLTGEASGFLPDPQTKESRGGIWHLGDTYNSAIGQGDVLVTPIELLNYISAVANKGKFYQLHIAKKFFSGDSTSNIVASDTGSSDYPKVVKDISIDANYFQEVEKGMIDGTQKPYGTSYSLYSLPMQVAAKTGTSQINFNTKINALFVGYAPVKNPQIEVLVLVEHAQEGSLNAIPVAKDVFQWYYDHRMTNNQIDNH